MTKTVPAAQAGDGNTRDMLPVACDDNAKETCTSATIKSDSFDEKTKKSSAPSLENGANNGVSSGETAEKSAKGVVGLTITTADSSTADVPMDAVHVVQSESPRERNFSNFQQFETNFSDGYDSDGEMGP